MKLPVKHSHSCTTGIFIQESLIASLSVNLVNLVVLQESLWFLQDLNFGPSSLFFQQYWVSPGPSCFGDVSLRLGICAGVSPDSTQRPDFICAIMGGGLEVKHPAAPPLLTHFVSPQGDPDFPLKFRCLSRPQFILSDLLTAFYSSASLNSN